MTFDYGQRQKKLPMCFILKSTGRNLQKYYPSLANNIVQSMQKDGLTNQPEDRDFFL